MNYESLREARRRIARSPFCQRAEMGESIRRCVALVQKVEAFVSKVEAFVPSTKAEQVHTLKCWPEHFDALFMGTKTVELRKDDRNFKVGDMLILREYDPQTGQYTGRGCFRDVTHILRGEQWLQPGIVALSICKTD